MEMKTVLLADIIQSRKSEDRYKTQKKLLSIIEILNKAYNTHLVRRVEISSGDSFQGLFDQPSSAFLYIRIAQMLMYPEKIRGGIGVGSLDYIDDNFGTNLLDGEAYHNARKAIELNTSSQEEIVSIIMNNANVQQIDAINIVFNMYFKLRQFFGVNSLRISLVNELLNPMSIYGEVQYLNNVRTDELKELEQILLDSYASKSRGQIKNELNFTRSGFKISELQVFALNTCDENKNKRFNNSDFVLRGIQNDIAQIVGTSRQNVQKYFSKAVADERMYAASLITLLDEVIK